MPPPPEISVRAPSVQPDEVPQVSIVMPGEQTVQRDTTVVLDVDEIKSSVEQVDHKRDLCFQKKCACIKLAINF